MPCTSTGSRYSQLLQGHTHFGPHTLLSHTFFSLQQPHRFLPQTVPILPYPVEPRVWDTSTPVIATHHQPVLVHLKDPSSSPSRPKFPTSKTHSRGLKPIITDLLSQRLLIPVDSPNTLQFFLWLACVHNLWRLAPTSRPLPHK